jgi:hypothetical protein
MNLLTILEVAIGIMFVWFLLSMLVSAVQEFISNLLKWRARDLEQAIRVMLEDPAIQKKLEVPLDTSSQGRSLRRWFRRLFAPGQPAYAPVNQLAAAGAIPATDPAHSMISVTQPGGLAGGSSSGAAAAASAEPLGRQAPSLGEQFYNHPLVRHLSLDINQRKPSYIPTSQFAEVMLDLIVDAGKETSPIRHSADLAEQAVQGLEQSLKDSITWQFNELVDAAQRALTQRVVDDEALKRLRTHALRLRDEYPQLEPAVQNLLSIVELNALNVRPLVGQLLSGTLALSKSNSELGHTLDVIVTRAVENAKDADDAIAQVRTNVATWFDSSMGRLSGYYKRRVQRVAFAIGIAVALFLGIDSFAIGKTLWFDQTMRAVIVTEAEQATQAPEQQAAQTPEQLIGRLSSLQIPAGWTVVSDRAVCSGYFGFKLTRCIYPAGLGEAANQLFKASFFQTLLGIIVTGIAAAQGAPFWFELLSKVINMRGSGGPPAGDKGRT